MALRLACRLTLVAFVATSCGGAVVPDGNDASAPANDASPVTDSGADAAPLVAACGLADASYACTGDPGCCPPYRARVVDLVNGCSDDTRAFVEGCLSPAACGRPTTGDLACYTLRDPSGGPDVVVVTSVNVLASSDSSFTPCDAATSDAAFAQVDACP